MTPEAHLRQLARTVGFDLCRITSVLEPWMAGRHLQSFIEAGHHGEMAWMETTLDRRQSPTALWPEARSAVVVGLNYGPQTNPLEKLDHVRHANISVYAQGRDYHLVLKKKLKQLARGFAQATGADLKVFVDTAPLMEKPLARKAGLGWQGKHTNLVSRHYGSWLFLGVMLTTAELMPDAEETDHCGTCRACLDICPTGAFPAPYQIDARLCISYLTIEYKGPIPRALRPAMGNRIYGCDDCLAVCPWNKYAQTATESAFWARSELKHPELSDLAGLDDEGFREVFSGSPVKRIGRNRFLRNVLIAIANSGDKHLLAGSVIPHLDDPDPVVRGSAVWALACLDEARFVHEKATRFDLETDAEVRQEWLALDKA